jgi:cell wall assembly regulator SMI1
MTQLEEKLKDLQLIHLGDQPPPTEIQVAELERELGAELPADYRSFLLCWGFSTFDKSTKIRSMQPSKWAVGGYDSLSCFYGLGRGGSNDLRYNAQVYEKRMPRDLLPIGCDDGGSQFCIELSPGVEVGKVYFWDREREPEQLSRANLSLMAASFTEFIKRFEEDDE